MGNQQSMLECKQCKKKTLHTRTTPNTILHIFLTFITFGLWLLVWILFISKGTPQCMTCGNDRDWWGLGFLFKDWDKHKDHKKIKKKGVDMKRQKKSIPAGVLSGTTIWNVHKVKNPKEFGGWSKWMNFWAIIPPIGLIIGIIGLSSDSVIRNVQAKALIFGSLVFVFIGVWNFVAS